MDAVVYAFCMKVVVRCDHLLCAFIKTRTQDKVADGVHDATSVHTCVSSFSSDKSNFYMDIMFCYCASRAM